MAQSRTERVKYGLLKAVDVSGFSVLDPVVRLCFGEEPRKQINDIFRFLLIPTAFVVLCLGLWAVIAPRHKTKSGEVPTPTQVWDALVINDTLDARENEKQFDFELSGDSRIALIAEIETMLEAKQAESTELKARLLEVEQSAQAEIDGSVEPLQEQLELCQAENKKAKAKRQGEIQKLARSAVTDKTAQQELLLAIRADNDAKDVEREAEGKLKDAIKEFRDNPPASLKKAQLASNAAANEVQHLKKRLDYLDSGNRAERVAKAESQSTEALRKLDAASTPAAVLSAARAVVRGEQKAERTAEQEYPRAATIWFQVRRSLFTVFVGFIMAAAIAIPVGIMCGLNQVVMACLMPLISIFKPVSPVVWLLIFQIIVGAFFPDPENHPLFVTMGNIPFIGSLGVNPALVFSACTVAMCAVWPALVNTALGVSSVDQDHMNVARVLRLGLWSRLFRIIIPSALPLVFAGLRISLGVGWMVLIAAEALSSSSGLGKFVWDEYQNGSSHSFANIIFACFVVGIIGFFLDRIMVVLQRIVSFDDGAATV